MHVLSLGAIIVQVVGGGLSPPQRFLPGIPIKIAIIGKIKSALGTMRRGKSFVTFSTTTKTISSELSLICSWTFDFNSSYRGQIPVKEKGLKYYLVCYSPNVGFDRLLALWPCQLMNSTKKIFFNLRKYLKQFKNFDASLVLVENEASFPF